jgi:hypothetical protein
VRPRMGGKGPESHDYMNANTGVELYAWLPKAFKVSGIRFKHVSVVVPICGLDAP